MHSGRASFPVHGEIGKNWRNDAVGCGTCFSCTLPMSKWKGLALASCCWAGPVEAPAGRTGRRRRARRPSFRSPRVPAARSTQARLNDKLTATFLVDTGVDSDYLSDTVAGKIGPPTAGDTRREAAFPGWEAIAGNDRPERRCRPSPLSGHRLRTLVIQSIAGNAGPSWERRRHFWGPGADAVRGPAGLRARPNDPAGARRSFGGRDGE